MSPMIVYDVEGNELEVPSTDELADLKSKAEKAGLAEEFEKLQSEIELPEGQNFNDYLKELQESANPNWREARRKMSSMEKALQEKGMTLDAEGNVVEPEKFAKPEDVKTEAEKAALNVFLNQHKTSKLAKYDEETRKVVEHYFDKFSAGEELTIEKIDKYLADSEKIALPESSSSSYNISGKGPVIKPKEGQGFADTPEGEEMAKTIFGDEAYSNQK